MSAKLITHKTNEIMEAIQYTGDNLLDVLSFTGKCDQFSEWFKSDEEYVSYVRSSGNEFKIFYQDGTKDKARVRDWIVKETDSFFAVYPNSLVDRKFKEVDLLVITEQEKVISDLKSVLGEIINHPSLKNADGDLYGLLCNAGSLTKHKQSKGE